MIDVQDICVDGLELGRELVLGWGLEEGREWSAAGDACAEQGEHGGDFLSGAVDGRHHMAEVGNPFPSRGVGG